MSVAFKSVIVGEWGGFIGKRKGARPLHATGFALEFEFSVLNVYLMAPPRAALIIW